MVMGPVWGRPPCTALAGAHTPARLWYDRARAETGNPTRGLGRGNSACLALWLAAWLPVAEAHAELVSAYPAPGAQLDAAPAEIRLMFSERIGSGSSIQLYGPQFRSVAGVRSGPDPATPELLRGFPPALAPDIYTVEWNAASLDGHTVSGSYAFEVRRAPAAGAGGRLDMGGRAVGGPGIGGRRLGPGALAPPQTGRG